MFLAETVETGDKNRDVTDDIFRAPYMFCEENLGNFNTSEVGNTKNLYEQNFDGEANGSAVVDFY